MLLDHLLIDCVSVLPAAVRHERGKDFARRLSQQLCCNILVGKSADTIKHTSFASQTQPTLARIAFSIPVHDTESDPCWGWLDLAYETTITHTQIM